MTAPRWAGLGHAEIAAMVAAGPGPSASAGAERAWRDAAAALADVHRELSGQVRGLPGGWSGTAADGVTVALGTLDGWVVSATADAERTADALATQAGLAADLRARMPAAAAPTPPETAPVGPALLDDWAAADLAAGNSAGRAAELMIRYDDDTHATGAPWTGWGAAPVVTHDGTAAASPAVPAPPPGGPPHGTGGAGGDAGPVPVDGAGSGTTVFAGIGFGGLTAAVLTGNGRAGVPGARPIDVGGPSAGRDPADAAATDDPRTGGTPAPDTAPGTGDPETGDSGAAPASPAGDAGTPGDRGGPDDGGTAVTAAVLAGGALGGAGILIGATIRGERQARDGRSPSGDGDTTGRGTPPGDGTPPPGGSTPPGGDTPPVGDAPRTGDTPHPDDARDRPGDTTPSGAEHRPPSGDATTSGTRAPSGVPATGAADGVPPSTHDGPVPDATGDPAPHGATPTGPDDPTAGGGAPDRPTTDGPTPGSPAGAQPTGPDTTHPHVTEPHVTEPRIADHAVAPHCPTPAGPPGPAHHAVTTGDLAVPHLDATHGAATHGRYALPPVPPHGDPAGVPVGAVPAAPPPVAAAVGAPADLRVPAWRLVADRHAVPDDPLEQPDARPDPGVLRPEARWRGRG
ncbi:PPE domain-containing protein [Pseudonocardia sp. Ae505_Ps2]|uniref:PPE domain-containing protein n=1 Tax=Pseudonocardia sp. Ae505_Ps2 TaxID=1885034 RepID=UPI00094ED97A|nr:PPE domain-containing protein [Pseudonocardia sp. Ae505_Ps2]OLM10388.1 hypothetical protein Ae505Ps2_0511 [Pseudonocardia sp. Ae505_Ps2]